MIQHNKQDYYITGITNNINQKTSFWISKTGNTDAYYCFSPTDYENVDKHIEENFDAYIKYYEEMHKKAFNRDFNIDTPLGQLRVYAKHQTDSPNDFPGVYIDIKETNDMLACVEYESVDKQLQTCVYQPGNDEPVAIIKHTNIETED